MEKNKRQDLAHLIDESVEREKESIVGFFRDLLRIPSVTGDEKRVQEFVEKKFIDMGLEVKVWEPDESKMKDHPEYVDTGKTYVDRPNVVGIFRGKGGSSLLLNGHTDVVTPEPVSRWEHEPWGAETREGKIYGRGACDMKGGVAGMIKALEILLQLNLAPSGDVILEAVVDEEASGNGTLASLLEGYTADAAVFTEPTTCAVMPAHRGGQFWRIYVDGAGAHAGVKFYGVSAAEKGMLIYRAIDKLEKQRDKKGRKAPLFNVYPLTTPICVGKFMSGEYTSAVPQECLLEGTIEFLPGETLEKVKKEFLQAVESASRSDGWLKKHPPRVEWFGISVLPSQVPQNHPLVKSFETAYHDIVGKKAPVAGFPAGCDMRIRVLHGKTPSLLFGPGNLREAHRVDEYLEIDELIRYTKVLALGMLEWSGMR
jgi:acetylornithine deacetylase